MASKLFRKARQICYYFTILSIFIVFFNSILLNSQAYNRKSYSTPPLPTLQIPLDYYDTSTEIHSPSIMPEKPVEPQREPQHVEDHYARGLMENLKRFNTTVLVMTYDRPDGLNSVMSRLFEQISSYPTFLKNFVVSQDGSKRGTTGMINSMRTKSPVPFHHIQRLEHDSKKDGVWNIAQHYHFAFHHVFDVLESEYIIVVEDDCMVSPDFFEFFDVAVTFMANPEQRVWCASSWNDLGFNHLYLDPHEIFRTQFFPGLGWMMSRKVWRDRDLYNVWPASGWDYFFRTSFVSKGEDCLVPRLSRSRNFGNDGATVNSNQIYEKLLKNIDHSQQDYGFQNIPRLSLAKYEEDIRKEIEEAAIIDFAELPKILSFEHAVKRVYVLPYEYMKLIKIFKQLKITYHEQERTHHNHMIRVTPKKNTELILLNKKLSPYMEYIPSEYSKKPDENFKVVHADFAKVSCDEVCRSKDMKCDREHFDYIMSCDVLQEHFPCEKGCQVEVGDEIPCYVNQKDNRNYQMCIIDLRKERPRCKATHKDTVRLCPCI